MTDTEKLKSKIEASGFRIRYIAERLGLTYQGFQNKVDGKSEFKQTEIRDLCTLLNISLREKEQIFFAK